MRLMKGKVRLKPIVERVSEVLDVEQRRVRRATVVQVGETVEVQEGMVVRVDMPLKKFSNSDDGTVVVDESDILAYE